MARFCDSGSGDLHFLPGILFASKCFRGIYLREQNILMQWNFGDVDFAATFDHFRNLIETDKRRALNNNLFE